MTTEKPKTILIACGRAIATSMVVAQTIKKILSERGIEVTTIACKVAEVPKFAPQADLVVSTTQLPDKLDIPVIVTLAFLTGMGKERIINQIVSYIS